MIYQIRVMSLGIGAMATATYVALQMVAGNPVAGSVSEGLVVGTISFLGSYFMLKQKVDDLKDDLRGHKDTVEKKFDKMTETVDTISKDVKGISKSVNELVGESRGRALGHMRTRSDDGDD